VISQWILVPEILGGMFGIRHLSQASRVARKAEFDKMLADFGVNWTKGKDQYALRAIVAPHAVSDSLVHDSYLCKSDFMKGALTVPFPTQREPAMIGNISTPNFVGNSNNYGISTECPKECRPSDHQDWKAC